MNENLFNEFQKCVSESSFLFYVKIYNFLCLFINANDCTDLWYEDGGCSSISINSHKIDVKNAHKVKWNDDVLKKRWSEMRSPCYQMWQKKKRKQWQVDEHIKDALDYYFAFQKF